MYVCDVCGLPKDRTEFKSNGRGFKGTAKCKPCSNELAYERRAIQKKINKAYVCEYLSTHPCVDCGETDPIVLEFDHVRGEKKRSVSLMVHLQPLATVIKEIAKCDVRCCNCHRRVTLARAGITRCGQD